MRTFSAVTTCNAQGYQQYGERMIASFDQHWPADVTLAVYVEGFEPQQHSPRIVYRDLLTACPELAAFKARHRDNPVAHGQHGRRRWEVNVDWRKPKVKIRRCDWGLGYWWDAVRFSHKMFSIFDAAEQSRSEVLFWIDSDIVVFADIPHAFLDEMMPEDCMVSCLRRPKFSECGFVGYNLRHPHIRGFLADLKALYTTDGLFHLREYHDSYVFDVMRRRYERRGCRTYDIAEGVGDHAGHVFINSRLGRYMDHMKGDRKTEGASRGDDLVIERGEEYWRRLADNGDDAGGVANDAATPSTTSPIKP